MSRLILLSFYILFIAVSFSRAQKEIIEDTHSAYLNADKELNYVYQKLLITHKSDVTFIRNLKNAQRSWIKFRDAQFKMDFPESKGHYDRNTLTTSQAIYLVKLTEDRTKKLREVLDPASVGLLAYYPFNGNADDESGNGNNGINNGAILTTDRFGHSNSAYLFDNNSYIAIPDLFPDTTPSFTFAAWVKKDIIDNSVHAIIYKGTKEGETSLVNNPGILGFGVNLYIPGSPAGSQNWYSANTTDSLKINTYYFLVGRYIKGQKVDLLIDGTLISSTIIPNLNLISNPAGMPTAIGMHTGPLHRPITHWIGIIDDVRIYNRALSDQEILSLFNEGGWTASK